MLWIPKINTLTNKEPWLAASFAWLLSGIGHLYSGAYGQGAFLLALVGLISIYSIMSSISNWTPTILNTLLDFFVFIILTVYASWSAFRLTKRKNSEDFERERTLSKDPWLAVFLSIVLPGMGHIYLRRWIVGILFFLGFFVFGFIFQLMKIDFIFAFIICRIFVSIHAYIAGQLNKVKPKRPLALFIIVYICICLLKDFFYPQLEKQFFQYSGPMYGTSMNPTLVKGDRVVVNSITYSFNDPKPGDVIMFRPPKNISNKKDPTCKRIIAIGGETIEIRDGNVYVDGQERNFGFQIGSYTYSESNLSVDNFSQNDNPYLTYGIDKPYYVPEGHYFVLGDNRQYSADSRWYGAIPRENIVGKVVKICWPPRRMGLVR